MAGSYNHCIDADGNLLSNEEMMSGMIENLGDAYEAIEEMYGMIWFLAGMNPSAHPSYLVGLARSKYQEGLAIAKALDKTKERTEYGQ